LSAGVSPDIPPLEIEISQSQEGHGLYDVCCVGDIPISLPAPAIANGIEDTVGARVRELPLTAERVRRELLK
jgi:CO/xanthine dehydrogenase Mo-binding subunit